jgi:chromosome segregation protein
VYLKSLTLKGFKSFADKSVINFDEGVSAIVGPNGSGKSNISEAVLWVLGERKASNLRVSSMEELIFSGSSARQAVGVAEVDIVLDNADHVLPIEFDEVVITRRMYRSGESEYLVNGAPSLRRDIIDILHDSGIGEGVHSIIRQGKLDAFLNARPEERRMLIEEAAGTLKHKERKVRAARQLKKMDDTLDRVHDVLKVIDSQLKPLERQASRAQRHDEYAGELRGIDLALAVDDLRSLQSGWDAIKRNETEIEAEAELVGFRLSEKEEELAKRQRALEEKGIYVGDINEQRIRCQSIMQRLDTSMRLVEEKGKNMVARLSDLRAVIYTSETRLNIARAELTEGEREYDENNAGFEAFYSRFNELSHRSEAINKQRRGADEAYTAASSSLRNHEKALEATRAARVKTTDLLESMDLEEGLLSDRADQIEEEFSSMQQLLSERRTKLENVETDLNRTDTDSALAKSDIDKRVRIVDARKADVNNTQTELTSLRAEAIALEEMGKAFESASPALSWITQNREVLPGGIEALPDIFIETGGFEQAIERLLGADVLAVVVDDIAAARTIAARLSAQGEVEGEVALLPLKGMRPDFRVRSERGERLLDAITVASDHLELAEALIGDVYVASDLGTALDFFERDTTGARFVTPDGAIVWSNGKVTLGAQASVAGNVLARKRKLMDIDTRVEELTGRLGEAEMALSEAEHHLLLAQQDDFELSQTRARLQGLGDSVREEAARLERSMTDLAAKRSDIAGRLKRLEVKRAASAPLLEEHEQRIKILEDELDATKEKVETASAELYRINQERSAVADELNDCKVDMETRKGAIGFHKNRVERLRNEIKELDKTLAVSRETERNLSIIRMRVDPLYSIYERLYQGAAAIGERLQEQSRLGLSDSTTLKNIIGEATKAVETARGDLAKVQERLNVVRIEKAKVENEVEHGVQRIVSENATPLEEALKILSPENRTASEARAETLRRKIANLGAVNHVAREEYEALLERHETIEKQIGDLEDARKKLTIISRALDRKMRNQFQETFRTVNENFAEIFSVLFPGGVGELVLVEGEEPDETGVEVIAHPKGKKITKLSMMSGGEKSLVALALMFAVYRTRSVPFYILDEVEAALDDSNLVRLIAYLESVRNQTQLILVTHQRRTMEMAECLYGVSMQAAGVTKLVSQRLDQAIRSVEQEALTR